MNPYTTVSTLFGLSITCPVERRTHMDPQMEKSRMKEKKKKKRKRKKNTKNIKLTLTT
jgi:hypothetical protein